VVTNTAIANFTIIRYGSATHTVDTDQRLTSLTPMSKSGTTYNITIPGDSGVALLGYWMLFTPNSEGVPSVATTIKITTV